MYCKIKEIECPHAGQITVNARKEWGEKEGLYSYTICYKEGGRVACTLGI